jgi:hypothetical protein
MDKSYYFFIVAAIFVAIIPLVSKMMALRIKMLRFLRLNWLADWHQRNFHGFVIAVRVILGVLAIVLVVLGLTGG